MKLPKDNPIIDTGLEMTVSYVFPSDAVVGILYNSLHQKDEKVGLQKLPVSNIPDEIRRMDPNLKNKPTHQLTCKDGFVQIGENVLCIGGTMPYATWDVFEKFIGKILGLLSSNSLLKAVEHVKLRYLNFYEENIFNSINLNISMSGVEHICSGSTVFRTEIPCDESIFGVLQITNGVHVKNESMGLDNDGSLIDLQTITRKVSMDNLPEVIKKLHEQVELMFVKLTKKV